MKKHLRAAFLAALSMPMAYVAQGQTDTLLGFTSRASVWAVMADSTQLRADVYRPVLQTNVTFPVTIPAAPPLINAPISGQVTVLRAGTQYFIYPEQDDPRQLPALLLRTPYDRNSPAVVGIGTLAALLGYAGVVQDMRGRFGSQGAYIPVYSEGWNKNPYQDFANPLDVTNGTARAHQDGAESLSWLLGAARALNDTARLVNGKIGMVGPSALGIAQYLAAAAQPIDPQAPGLKCLMPIVATGEFYGSAGFQNGVFREAMLQGWLNGTLGAGLLEGVPDGSLFNTVHTPSDFGLSTIAQVQAVALDAWTTEQRAAYPDSDVRRGLDISRAPVNALGQGEAAGPFSRYRNMQVPMYHLTGWWDVFVDGQIRTFQQLRNELPASTRRFQKLVIGPWTHQTIGERSVGDLFFPPQVGDVLGINYAALETGDFSQITQLFNSEIYEWLRYFLGEPTVRLPAGDWQFVDSTVSQIQVRVPASDYDLAYLDFINFLNGGAGLPSIPIQIRLSPTSFFPPLSQTFDVPATGVSLFGDTALSVIAANTKEFDETAPEGVPAVRFYVTGPIDDGVADNASVGNYWRESADFPLTNTTPTSFFLSADGAVRESPAAVTGSQSYVHDPDAPVRTIGGGNLGLGVPQGGRLNQGPLNLADPAWAGLTLNRPDVLAYTSEVVTDSLSVVGFPQMKLFAQSLPAGAQSGQATATDFMVRVLDVYPDGREIFVTEGTVNARARAYARSVAEGQPNDALPFTNIAADSLYAYEFELLPLAYTWGQGHRLKVLISSSNWPRYQSNPNIPLVADDFFRRSPGQAFTYTFEGNTLAARTATQTVRSGGDFDTQLRLPVLGGSITSQPVAAVGLPEQYLIPYPNPVQTALYLRTNYTDLRTYTVFDQLGRLMAEGTFAGGLVVPTEGLGPGLYVLRCTTATGSTVTNRFIKAK